MLPSAEVGKRTCFSTNYLPHLLVKEIVYDIQENKIGLVHKQYHHELIYQCIFMYSAL